MLSGELRSVASVELAAALDAVPDLEARLVAFCAEAEAGSHGLVVPRAELMRQLGRTLPPVELDAALTALRPGDLLLAVACALGLPPALERFDREVLTPVAGWLVRSGQASPVFADEVVQRVRERLLVGKPGAPARIGTFSGRGALVNWVRAVATRVATDLRQEELREAPATSPEGPRLEESRLFGHDPELSFIRQRYQPEFRAAFGEALAQLEARDRSLIKLHHVDGLSVESIGTIYRASKSTAGRWIQQARERLLERTRALLQQRLSLDADELESMIALVRSQLDVSLEHLRSGRTQT